MESWIRFAGIIRDSRSRVAEFESMKPQNNSLVAALLLGFAPSATLLLLALLKQNSVKELFVILTIGSLLCCFVSSYLLFKRRTGMAIVGGICLILLNLVVSFFCGCAAMVNGFH